MSAKGLHTGRVYCSVKRIYKLGQGPEKTTPPLMNSYWCVALSLVMIVVGQGGHLHQCKEEKEPKRKEVEEEERKREEGEGERRRREAEHARKGNGSPGKSGARTVLLI